MSWVATNWAFGSIIMAAVAGLVNILLVGRSRGSADVKVEAEQTLESRMTALAETMSGAAQLMTLVQSEIQARQEKIAQLAGEVKRQEQLAALTQEAKDAVAAVFHAELVRESRKANWKAFWIGFGFFILGSVVTFLVTFYVHPAWG